MNDNFKEEAINLVEHHKESVEYFSTLSNAFEKATTKVFLEASGVKS